MRTPQEKYQAALDKIYELQQAVEDLETELSRLQEDTVQEEIEFMDEWEDLDVVVFLRDIGFDPDNLPSSLGERMAIRDLLTSAKRIR